MSSWVMGFASSLILDEERKSFGYRPGWISTTRGESHTDMAITVDLESRIAKSGAGNLNM